jgi:positive regulator of sigma E activity
MNKKHKKQKIKKFPMKRYLKVSFVYFLLFLVIFGIIDYYAMMVFNFTWFFILSAVLAIGIGYFHVIDGRRDHIDEVADELL